MGMTRQEPAAADLERASERWRTWLASETSRRQGPPGSALHALWDTLEAWFASEEFAGSPVAAAMAAPPDGRGPVAHAVLTRHRQATRQLLEDLARSAGARDPRLSAAAGPWSRGPRRGHVDRHGGRPARRELTQSP